MPKLKKRGFVMTGGGAKGLYEAGVINAFHITGMEFDVITGSSIGAMNSAFFSEYLFFKRRLDDAVRRDPLRAVEAMDARVRAFHHAWLQMPAKKLVDDSPQGPIGQMKDDLEGVNLSLPLLVRLGWWWTDPNRAGLPSPLVWPGLIRLGGEMLGHLGGPGVLLNTLKFDRAALPQALLRAYMRRFGIERALIPADQDHRLKDIFTLPVSPLTEDHLSGDVSAADPPGTEQYIIVDPARTMKEYIAQDVVMRVTRSNYRTGRLEISAYVPLETFARYLQKQAWRLEIDDLEKVPLGSARLQVPGNPNVVNAALCSGRFPGVFAPFPLQAIYSQADAENVPLYHLLNNWLADPGLEKALKKAYQEVNPALDEADWLRALENWRKSDLRELFPKVGDIYVDGGTIDNTPSNSAVDYIREWVDLNGLSRREVEMELFIIYLEKEPRIAQQEIGDPGAFEVVNRTLAIQAAAKSSADANTVDTINTFGQRGESLGLALKLLTDNLQGLSADLTPAQLQQLEAGLYQQASALGLRGYLGDSPQGILARLRAWADRLIANGLPLQVDAVKIYPEVMPMDTLQFTERLGYQKENAIQMLSRGCSDTLWSLRAHLESLHDLDERDQQVLALARKWMGIQDWPATQRGQAQQRSNWMCQRSACVYHARYCAHGAAMNSKASQ